MSGILGTVLRLLLPLFREWWKNKNWSAHSIRNMKEIHMIFGMFFVLFALFLYVIDHGLGIYLQHSEKLHTAAIEAGKVERVIIDNKTLTARNDQLSKQLEAANNIIAYLMANNTTAPPKKDPEVTSAQRLEGLKKKYGGTDE